MSEEGRQRAAVEASALVAELIVPMQQPATLFGGFFPEVEEEGASTSLRLWPRQFPGSGS